MGLAVAVKVTLVPGHVLPAGLAAILTPGVYGAVYDTSNCVGLPLVHPLFSD